MKLLIAFVRPEKLESVQAVLQPHEACLVAVGQVIGFGSEPARESVYRGAAHQVRPAQLRLEILVDDEAADDIIDAIAKSGATDKSDRLGDGAILVMPLSECIRIGGARQPRVAEEFADST
jgi:nitrogen regulatory protein P-II 1